MATDVYKGDPSLKDNDKYASGSPYSWSGGYIGGTAGFGVGQAENDVTLFETKKPANALPFLPSIDELSGAVYGGHAGFNFQRERWVFGLEAAFNGSDIEGTSTAPGLLGSLIQTETKVNWYATGVGRIGVASGKTLFYGKGGIAWADVDSSSTLTTGIALPGQSVALISDDEQRIGWVAGLGIEHAFDNHWTARVEWEHVDLGEESATGAVLVGGKPIGLSATQRSKLDFDAIKLGGSYKF